MRKPHGKRREEPRRTSAGRGGAADDARAGALPPDGSGGVETRGEGWEDIAERLGSAATERGGDALFRIAGALERIAEVAESLAPQPRRRETRDCEVTETDRAAARAIARRMGLHVRETKR